MTPEDIDNLEDWQLNDRAHYYLMGGHPGAMPNYSGDIAAAWQVVEKLRELGFNLSLFYSNEGFYCHFGEAGLACEAGTAPLAICRAALKAVATEQEKPVYGHYEGRYSWTQGQTHYPARIVQVQEPEQQCSKCGCAFSARDFEGLICPDCVAEQENLRNLGGLVPVMPHRWHTEPHTECWCLQQHKGEGK